MNDTPDTMTVEELLRLQRLRRQTASGEARSIREAANVAQSEIARTIGVPPSSVNFWEKGRRQPRGASALRYAEVLDLLEAAAAEPVNEPS